MSEDILAVENLSVNQNTKIILDSINFSVRSSEIHAVVGDNESGKTIFAEVISGLNGSYTGRIIFDGRIVHLRSVRNAHLLGIEIISQSPNILRTLNVLENIYPNRTMKYGLGYGKKSQFNEAAKRLLERFSIRVDLNAQVSECNYNEKIIIHVIRGLCTNSRLLIVNDISKMLTPSQVEILNSELSSKRHKGTSIVYVTSNIDEAHNFADRISFFQNGRLMTSLVSSNLDKFELVQLSFSNLYKREALHRSNFELFYLNNFYSSVIDSVPLPFVIINRENRIIFVSKYFLDSYGTQKDKLLNTSILDSLLSDRALGAKDLELIKTKKRNRITLAINGKACACNLYSLAIHDDANSFLGSMLIFGRLNAELRINKYSQLLELNRKNPFILHEIRNPLGIISNYLKLIKQSSQTSEASGYIVESEKEIKRIKSIVSSLMGESYISMKGSQKPRRNVRKIIDEIIGISNASIRKKKIRVINTAGSKIWIRYDEAKIREILINLITNAMEAILEEGTIRIGCRYRGTGDRRYVVLRVADNGVGIAKDRLKLIFRPFYTTKRGRRSRGLGLSICKDIVSSWGGTISVDSTPNIGSAFTICLPE